MKSSHRKVAITARPVMAHRRDRPRVFLYEFLIYVDEIRLVTQRLRMACAMRRLYIIRYDFAGSG